MEVLKEINELENLFEYCSKTPYEDSNTGGFKQFYLEWYRRSCVLFDRYINKDDTDLIKFKEAKNNNNGYTLHGIFGDISSSWSVLVNRIKREIEDEHREIEIKQDKNMVKDENKSSVKNIFIIHGHDKTTVLEVKDLIRQIGHNPIILNEQPNAGRTLIDKIEKAASEAHFAISVFSPDDDIACDCEDNIKQARPNVLFETGFFMGRLGRSNVAILLTEEKNNKICSDLHGIGYILKSDNWKIDISKELKNANINVNFESLM